MLCVLKSIREQTGKGPGDTIEVVVWKDEAVRTVGIPACIQGAVEERRSARRIRETELHTPQRILSLDCGSEEGRDAQNRMGKAIAMLKKGVKTPG